MTKQTYTAARARLADLIDVQSACDPGSRRVAEMREALIDLDKAASHALALPPLWWPTSPHLRGNWMGEEIADEGRPSSLALNRPPLAPRHFYFTKDDFRRAVRADAPSEEML